jgi:hypothetical protein
VALVGGADAGFALTGADDVGAGAGFSRFLRGSVGVA